MQSRLVLTKTRSRTTSSAKSSVWLVCCGWNTIAWIRKIIRKLLLS